jgi:hypothetical protein
MAKFKAAKTGKSKTKSTRGLIPCLLVVIGVIALVNLLFYAMLKSGS